MNKKEDHLRISKNGDIHTLSDRIPFKWKELAIWTSASFVFLIWFLGVVVGIFVAVITLVGYTLFRFASWIFYSELKIDTKSGRIIRIKKILKRTQRTELISDKFDPAKFEFTELTRSGKTKFLMSYRTHKLNELLILRNEADKIRIEQYIAENMN